MIDINVKFYSANYNKYLTWYADQKPYYLPFTISAHGNSTFQSRMYSYVEMYQY